MVVVPGLDVPDYAVPLENVLVGIADHAGLQRDHRIGDLEGRGRQLWLSRPFAVAGDDQIIVDLIAGEGAGRSRVREVLGQIRADFAAWRRDIGEAARRPEAGGSEKPERVAAIDHGCIRSGLKTAA